MNKWRSRTAETIFKNVQGIEVKSAGTEASARVRLSEHLLDWADVVLAMEYKHKDRIMSDFRSRVDLPQIDVLDIPDDYTYMDEELMEILKLSIQPYMHEI